MKTSNKPYAKKGGAGRSNWGDDQAFENPEAVGPTPETVIADGWGDETPATTIVGAADGWGDESTATAPAEATTTEESGEKFSQRQPPVDDKTKGFDQYQEDRAIEVAKLAALIPNVERRQVGDDETSKGTTKVKVDINRTFVPAAKKSDRTELENFVEKPEPEKGEKTEKKPKRRVRRLSPWSSV